MSRAIAVLGGLTALVLALAAFGFALWATDEGSVLGGIGKAAVLALAGSGVAAACGGLAVASQGIPPRAWLLHGLAVVLAVASYALALGIAETA
ncbi:MAG: hypothetical protein ACRDLS_16240 [Solirubrobacteraceae bacterium]